MGGAADILLVDDEESILFAIADYLSLLGYRVIAAREFEQALSWIQTREFHVLVVDFRLGASGALEGLELAKIARRQRPRTFIVGLTAYTSGELSATARACGVDALLAKPTPLAEVARVIGQGCEALVS